ncbi:MAG: hypothetical protein ACE5D7_01600, partial [Fidelibacterota bacterium]
NEYYITTTRILGIDWRGTVKFNSGEGESSQLIGLTISTAVSANYEFSGIGCFNSSPTIRHCEISGNHGVDGGGIHLSNSNAVLKHLSIVNNVAVDESEVDMGSGGGIFIGNSNPIIHDLYITQNSSLYGGAIIIVGSSNPIFERCVINGNTSERGSVIGCGLWAEASFINCTIVNNVGDYLVAARDDSAVHIINSIIYSNDTPLLENDDTPMLINYSNLQFEYEGVGNLQEPPLFVDISIDNFYLQETSPGIDAGTAFFEFGGEILIDLMDDEYFGSAPDMGAYEFYPQGDINLDGFINISDAVMLVGFIFEIMVPTFQQFQNADLIQDENLNILDVISLVNIILEVE